MFNRIGTQVSLSDNTQTTRRSELSCSSTCIKSQVANLRLLHTRGQSGLLKWEGFTK